MAGLDERGGILPPPPGAQIDRTRYPHWRVRKYPSDQNRIEIQTAVAHMRRFLQQEGAQIRSIHRRTYSGKRILEVFTTDDRLAAVYIPRSVECSEP